MILIFAGILKNQYLKFWRKKIISKFLLLLVICNKDHLSKAQKNEKSTCLNVDVLQHLVGREHWTVGNIYYTYRSTAVVENGGGILRNISSYIATSPQGEDYR